MLDSVVIVVHGLKDLLYQPQPGKVDKVAVPTREYVEFLRYPDSGNFIELSHVQNLVHDSWHYNASAFVDHQADQVTVNFSIPKMLYGNNILQFVQNDKILGGDSDTVEYHLATLYQRFYKQVKRAVFLWYGKDVPDHRIEVKRLDFCFNCFFPTKQDAVLYFNALRDIKKKYARKATTSYNHWETSLHFSTQSHGFKVYLKGPEYDKHDRKAHSAYNKQRGGLYYDTQKLSDLAHLVLRYEVTGRNAWLSSRAVKVHKARHPHLWAAVGEKLHEKLSRRTFRLFLGLDPITKDINRFCGSMDKHSFMLALDQDIFTECFASFWAFVKSFQVQHLSFPEMVSRVRNHNEQYKNKLSAQFLTFCKFCADGNTFDVIRSLDLFPDRTFFRYKKIFLSMFGANNAKSAIFVPTLDYSAYAEAVRLRFFDFQTKG